MFHVEGGWSWGYHGLAEKETSYTAQQRNCCEELRCGCAWRDGVWVLGKLELDWRRLEKEWVSDPGAVGTQQKAWVMAQAGSWYTNYNEIISYDVFSPWKHWILVPSPKIMISSGELQLLLLLFMLVILALLQNPLTCYVCPVLLLLSNTPFHQDTLI